jgi:hypothetical protein
VVFGILSFIGFSMRPATSGKKRRTRAGASCSAIARWCCWHLLCAHDKILARGGLWLNRPGAKMAAFLKDLNASSPANVTPWLPATHRARGAGIFSASSPFTTPPPDVLDGSRPGVAGFSWTHPQTWYSPIRAIIAQSIFTVVIGIGVGIWLGLVRLAPTASPEPSAPSPS